MTFWTWPQVIISSMEDHFISYKVKSRWFRLFLMNQFSHSVMSDSVTPWIAARQASLSITNSITMEFAQTHVHRVGDAIQPSHPLLSPSPPAPNPFQHQSLFQWANSLHEVAKVLEFQLQHHSLQRNPRPDLLQNGLVGSQWIEYGK